VRRDFTVEAMCGATLAVYERLLGAGLSPDDPGAAASRRSESG